MDWFTVIMWQLHSSADPVSPPSPKNEYNSLYDRWGLSSHCIHFIRDSFDTWYMTIGCLLIYFCFLLCQIKVCPLVHWWALLTTSSPSTQTAQGILRTANSKQSSSSCHTDSHTVPTVCIIIFLPPSHRLITNRSWERFDTPIQDTPSSYKR